MRLKSAACGLLAAASLAWASHASATEAIQAGERIRLEFTCRLANGELAATTDRELSERPGVSRAPIFRKRASDEPLVVVAGNDEGLYGKPGRRGFEGEIVARLGEALVGRMAGEEWSILLSAQVPKGLPPGERFLEMARIRQRPKEIRMSPDNYRAQTGKEPAVGQVYTTDPAFPGRVVAAGEEEVVIAFAAEVGATVETPIGKGRVRDGGNRWEIEIESRVGDLVRSGPMVGRITAVEERTVTIDYGHPFGGEVLQCDVKAARPEGVKP